MMGSYPMFVQLDYYEDGQTVTTPLYWIAADDPGWAKYYNGKGSGK